MNAPERTPFQTWAIVELMGHHQVAGRVTEEPVAGTNLLRVDVPAVGDWPEHTKYFGGGSIYALHPCTEEIARAAAARLQAQWGYTPMPVSVPDLTAASQTIRQAQAAQDEIRQLQAGGGAGTSSFDVDDDDDDDDGGPF